MDSPKTAPRRHPLHYLMYMVVLLTCLRVWVGPSVLVEPARAQIPDSGAQRKALVDEQRRTNQLLSDIKQLMEAGTLNVRVIGADNQSGVSAPGRKRRP